MDEAERGGATLIAVAAMAALTLFAAVALTVLSLHANQVYVQAVADLAALSGAGTSPSALVQVGGGLGPSCAVAAQVAQANRVDLTECAAVDLDLRVVLTRDVDLLLGWKLPVNARARAGPGLSG